MTTQAEIPVPDVTAGIPGADPAPAAPPDALVGRGRPAVEAPPVDEQRFETPADPPADEVTDPPPDPGPSKLERAKAGAEHAKRQRRQRQREAEEAARMRAERDQLAQQVAWERHQREEAQRQAQSLEGIRDPEKQFEVMQRLGVDPRQVAADAVKWSTPEGQAELARREAAETRKQFEDFKKQQAAQAEIQRQRTAEADFLRQAADADAHPTLSRLAKKRPQSLVNEGNAVCAEVYARTGRYPSFDQVLAYLEDEYSKALKDDKPTRDTGTPRGQRTTSPARDGQPAASARTITARASERAQLPKSVDEMTRDEQLAYFASKLREDARG